MTRTLLLDLDGTLVDTLPDLLASLNRVTGPMNLRPFTAPEVRPMIGDGAWVLVQRAMALRGRMAVPADLDALLADYTANVAGHSAPFPGVADGLARLAAAGWRLAVCTNKPERAARALLDALGFSPHLAAVGGGDSFPVRKPDPAHLLATLDAAGGRAARAVMLGDHQNDIQAARAANIACIFAAWGYGDDAGGAAETARDFAEACLLADRLLPAG